MTDDGLLLFIDAIEDDDALILLGDQRYRMPRALLPAEARAGMWLRVRLDAAYGRKMSEEIDVRRRRLSDGDSGGKIKL